MGFVSFMNIYEFISLSKSSCQAWEVKNEQYGTSRDIWISAKFDIFGIYNNSLLWEYTKSWLN